MAKNKKISSNFMRPLIGDENERKIGNYMESTGGGTPLEKGEKLKDHPEAQRVQQPRDEKGKFTYNAVNRKPLKYGPSRGTTVVPFLKGVKIKYTIKKDDRINYNGMIYLAGMDITAEQILTRFREWKEDEGFGVLETGISKKVGRRSNKEREAIAKNEQGLVNKNNDLSSLSFPGVRGDMRRVLVQLYKDKFGRNPSGKRWKEFVGGNSSLFSKEVNISLARKNPELFKQKYRTNINKAKKLDSSLSDDDVVQMMSTGKYRHFYQLHNELN